MARWLWVWGPAGFVMGAIFIASSLPDISLAIGGLSDVEAHSLAYGVLGMTMVRALADATWQGVTVSKVASAVLLSTAYGFTDEVHQLFVPGRVAEIRDLFADAVGAAVGVGLVWAWGIVLAAWRRAI
jgi:VanZ family protein